jgi:hypothetical protein
MCLVSLKHGKWYLLVLNLRRFLVWAWFDTLLLNHIKLRICRVLEWKGNNRNEKPYKSLAFSIKKNDEFVWFLNYLFLLSSKNNLLGLCSKFQIAVKIVMENRTNSLTFLRFLKDSQRICMVFHRNFYCHFKNVQIPLLFLAKFQTNPNQEKAQIRHQKVS